MWTKEETDQLFDLCKQFDLRFIVIADRFPSSRTVEELKDRYYNGMSSFHLHYYYVVLKFINSLFCVTHIEHFSSHELSLLSLFLFLAVVRT